MPDLAGLRHRQQPVGQNPTRRPFFEPLDACWRCCCSRHDSCQVDVARQTAGADGELGVNILKPKKAAQISILNKCGQTILEVPSLNVQNLDFSGRSLRNGRFTQLDNSGALWIGSMVIGAVVIFFIYIEMKFGIYHGLFDQMGLIFPAAAFQNRPTKRMLLLTIETSFLVFPPVFALEYVCHRYVHVPLTGAEAFFFSLISTVSVIFTFSWVINLIKKGVQDYFVFQMSNFSGSDISGSDWSGTTVRGCKFNGANISHSNTKGTLFQNITFDTANLANSKIYATTIEGSFARNANMNGIRFYNSRIEGCNFDESNLAGSDFTKTRIEQTRFHGANVAGANFSQAKFMEVDFQGAIANEKTKWPRGFNPVANGVVLQDKMAAIK
jgi:uncharacterized protein YjbI with pentapeptide repeats